jgi:hypothetical protein
VEGPRDESAVGKREVSESISNSTLLDQVLERAKLKRVLKQVRQNKGATGIDGMSVDELPDYLRHHWREIRAQLDTTQVTLPSPDAMETGRLPGAATTQGERARGMAHRQVGAWILASIEDPGAHAGVAGAVLQQFGAAESGGDVRDSIHRATVYVTRSHGGVGRGGREVFPDPD